MTTELKLLIVEDSEDDALLLLRELQKSGYGPSWERVDTPEGIKAALLDREWDVVVSDFSMPRFSGLDALRMVRETGLDIPFIIVSGKIGEETAVEAMRSGAHDYIFKGNMARLAPAIEREMAEAEDRSKRRQAEDALRESEGRYRLLLEAVTDYIYTTLVEDGVPVATSHGPGCVAVTGYTEDDYDLDPGLWLRMVPEEDRAAVLEQANAVLTGKEYSPLEHRIIHKDSRICWIRNSPVPRRDQAGNLIAFDGIVTDITERMQAEEAVKKWQNVLLSAQRITHLGSWELDVGNNKLIWSDEIFRIFGLIPQEFDATYEAFLEAVHPDDRAIVNSAYTRSIKDEIPYDIVHRIIRKSTGEIHYVHELCEHTKDSDGRIIRSLGTVHDITERKLAEDAAVKAKEEWERTFDAIKDPIMILDDNYVIVKVNRAMAGKLEITPLGAQGLTCYRVVHETSEPPEYCPYTQMLSNGKPHTAEFHAPVLGGYFSSSLSPLFGPGGELRGSICIARDITERKNLEMQLFHAQKMEAVGQLAGGVAHDFNNILTVITGYCTLIDMGMDRNDPQKANLSYVIAAADRAADLTGSLLTFSRKQEINPQPVDLNQIIRKTDKFLKRIIGEDIELRTAFGECILTVNADSGQIEQVLMNLATNARDAMPKGGLLSIETGTFEVDDDFIKVHGSGEPGRYASVSVTDSGEGMDEATCMKVFEPFFTTKEVGKGTGLGLSIVFGIIKQHNGFIEIFSEPGKGTAFRILLPLIPAAAAENPAGVEELIESGEETILVADDDATIRELTEKALGMFGYTVITALDGKDALEKFKTNRDRIKLAIMDIIMPEMNGKEALDEMRKINPEIKAIFISGYTADIIRKRGLIEQGLDFIPKPLNLKQLLIKIRAVLVGKS